MDLSKKKLPPLYRRNGRDCYLDPIRKKLIFVTPEETVRQRVISYLLSELRVPDNMLVVEDHLSHYGIKSNDRADIVVLALDKKNELVPLVVVECKAENIPLTDKTFEQAQRYSDSLGTPYTMLTNGINCFCLMYDDAEGKYVHLKELPLYTEMLAGEYMPDEIGDPPPRIPFERLGEELNSEFEEARKNDYIGDISQYTPMSLALPLFNLLECLLDVRVKMPVGDYGLFRLIEDYGVRLLSYGNGSGGQFFGPYRSFLVEVDGNAEFFSLSLSSYWKNGWDLDKKPPKTCLCVAHDDEKSSHHALQLVAEDNAVVNGNTVQFYHHGRIAIGRIGSGKKEELMGMVRNRFPKIIHGSRYYLGSIKNDHLLRLDEQDVIDLIVNLISYSIVRDEYREVVKHFAKSN